MSEVLKRWLVQAMYSFCVLIMIPFLAGHKIGIFNFTTVSQLVSLVPGAFGVLLRRAWYKWTLAQCGKNLIVDFLGAIRTPRTRVGNNCYLGVASWVGLAEIGDDFLAGSHVVILSGNSQHSFDRIDIPIRHQEGRPRMVKIGNDVWVGAMAIIQTDVGNGCVIGAGSVVTEKSDDFSILVGVPAKVIGDRRNRRWC